MKTLIITLSVIFIFGCASPTPYQNVRLAGDGSGGGYEEHMIPSEEDVYRYHLSFNANNHTKIETVVEYWNRRASELCVNGYKIERIRAEMNKATIDIESSFDFYHEGIIIQIPIDIKKDVKSPSVNGQIFCNAI